MEYSMESMDLMEQKVHELDARLKQMKEERDNVITENEELQVRKMLAHFPNKFSILSHPRSNWT